MNPIDYHCKVCHKPGVAYYDPECPISQLEHWRKALTCDKCYKFRDSLIKCKAFTARLCYLLGVFRASAANDDQKREALEKAQSKIRQKLIKTTQKIATVISDYYNVQNVWEVEFVNNLMENPDKSLRIIDAFHAGYRKIAGK